MAQRDAALEERLTEALGANRRGELRAFQQVPSTMDVAHALAAEGAVEGTLVWTLRQTQGRGRQGRAWASPAGGAYFSIVVRPARPSAEIPQLSLVAGLALAEAVQEVTRLHPSIRWPNDLLINGKKVAGILSEGVRGGGRGAGENGTTTYVVIGIGINVSTKPAEFPDAATSLDAAGGENPDPLHLTARLYRRFFRWYDVWSAEGFAPIREALRPWIGLFGQVVHLTAGNDRFEGTASDLDEAGKLVVRLDSGMMRAFEMGEVTLLRQQEVLE